MKKVLIALDYDPTAQKVADSGFSIAKSMKAEVVLLHVIGNANYYSSLEYSPIMGFSGFTNVGLVQAYDIEGLKESALNFLNKTKEYLGDESIQTLVKEGEFAESIMDTAKELHVDLIIMGSHSRRWLEKILMGSVTEKVLTNSKIPLFIIPTSERTKSK